MNESIMSRRRFVAFGSATVAGVFAVKAKADNPHTTADFQATDDPDVYTFTMSGEDRFFGRFKAFGEMNVPAGDGKAVLTAADGSQIVGVVLAAAEADDRTNGHFHFSWRDSVTVGDTTYVNTGRFARKRPPGLVVIAIIAILIGLLLPAVQK